MDGSQFLMLTWQDHIKAYSDDEHENILGNPEDKET